MERLATDAMALACILAGGAAGTAVTLAALDRDAGVEAVTCAAGIPAAPDFSVVVSPEDGRTRTVIARGGPCVTIEKPTHRRLHVEVRARAEAERVQVEALRTRAEAMRARAEATRRQLERDSETLERRRRHLERELEARTRRLERRDGGG